jgi:Zn finger protein HypA/HybF involved in hydrogenase expression
MNVFDGPPYFFQCSHCQHVFRRAFPLGLACPTCRSLRVRRCPFPLK